MPSNAERQRNGELVMKLAHAQYDNGDDQDDLTDLLTDLRHFLEDYARVDFDNCVRLSAEHYEAEIDEEDEEEPERPNHIGVCRKTKEHDLVEGWCITAEFTDGYQVLGEYPTWEEGVAALPKVRREFLAQYSQRKKEV